MCALVTCFGRTGVHGVDSWDMSNIRDYGGVRGATILLALVLATAMALWLNCPRPHAAAGYLPPSAFDILQVLPPPPVEGSAAAEADAALFRTTRGLQGTPRWQLAIHDIAMAPADLAADFSCALGLTLTADNAPRTFRLLAAAAHDADQASRAAKLHYKRPRPFLLQQGETCQPPEEVQASFDYPSGHSTRGWLWAEIMAQLAPNRAGQIRARGHAYGESRIICGVHSKSAVEAGHLTATAIVAALQANAAFQADLRAAREELQSQRLKPSLPAPDAAVCSTELALLGQPL